jgi:predicted O-methyltransferase YrrM
MDAQTWRAVDDYFLETLVPSDDALTAALAASAASGLPPIQVSAPQGKLLMLLAQMMRAERILEVGTLGGYSTIWLARGLAARGRLTTLEIDATHAQVARANLDRAGFADTVDVRLGRALDTLPQLEAEGAGPFDLSFIDADKQSNADYFRWALRMSRPGSVIVVDNVVRGGQVADASSDDAAVQGVRALLDLIASDPRVDATAIQTVGAKSYDGFALARVLS